MMGVSGTIAAEVFVLTGHVAGMSGPAGVLVVLAVGILSVAFALNYAELATTYPVTGGALTYVREAYGSGLRSFLVGSLDSLSSAFYAALSAVGFAYSLRVFLPTIPVVPVALIVVLAFTVLHLFGAGSVGRAQMLLGGVLFTLLGVYVFAGLTQPNGFSLHTLVPDGVFFVHDGVGANLTRMLATMALIFNAYVGFELIADDAEEVANPSRAIPIGLLGSLAIITVLYGVITLVTLGTIPWYDLAGSEMALTMAADRFMPGVGPAIVGIAGIIATLTSVNTAMLSATREALTLSRLGLWPRFMVRLGPTRTPYMAILCVGAAVALVSIVGLVDILSYISSSGYLFVMFWSGMAMIRLRRTYPDMERPFKVRLFPLTAYVQAATCVVVIAFTAGVALAFGAGVLSLLTIAYYLRGPLARALSRRAQAARRTSDRILLAIANPDTAGNLVALGASLAERVPGTVMELLSVAVSHPTRLPRPMGHLTAQFRLRESELLSKLNGHLRERNIPYFTRVRMAGSVSEGIVAEVERHGDVKLLIMGWPGLGSTETLAEHPVTEVLQKAPTNIAVFLNRGMPELRRILVPFGGGIHSRLALRLAVELAQEEDAEVTVLRCFCRGTQEQDDVHDELMMARESMEVELGEIPPFVTTKVLCAESVVDGINAELAAEAYQLVVIGAALARSLQTDLFGPLTDQIAEVLPCSVLLVSRYEPAPITWARKRVKRVTEPARDLAHA
jgi:amino acid transporter/nucleotide-binding universal stress UspA family protein